MLKFSSYMFVLLSICNIAQANPSKPLLSDGKVHKFALQKATKAAESVLERYYHLIDSDTDSLVHGILTILLKKPKSFMLLPSKTVDIILYNLVEKMGIKDAETVADAILLAIERKDQNLEKPLPVTVNNETKQKIIEAIDKFLDDGNF